MPGSSIFEDTIDESLAVIHEDFAHLLNDCRDVEDVILRIREEIKQEKPDFIKIVALGLSGEVLIGK